MERIELFDRYINNQLTDKERLEFDAKLKDDADFAGDYHVYLMTVDGIYKEAEQDNMDFGLAMKALTKEQLLDIIGKKEAGLTVAVSVANDTRRFRFKPWMWQVTSIAAVIVIAFTVVLNIQKQARNSIYDNIYACAQFEEIHSRGAAKPIDITKLDDSELKTKLPEMEKSYKDCEDPDDLYEFGYPLAMAYIRLHQPKPAVEILDNLVSKLQNDEYYEPEVREMRLVISMLK